MRQYVAIAPTLCTQARPVVEILVLATDEDEAVDRRRPADHPATRPDDVAPRRSFARLGVEQARVAGVVDGPEIADRQVDPEAAIRAAGLEQQDPRIGIGGQAVREHAARRTGPDDHVVVDAMVHAPEPSERPQALTVFM